MGIESSYNFKPIAPKITSSGVVGVINLKVLSQLGCEAVIDLLPLDHEHAIQDERQVVESQGIEYVHIPVVFDSPQMGEFQEFIDALD